MTTTVRPLGLDQLALLDVGVADPVEARSQRAGRAGRSRLRTPASLRSRGPRPRCAGSARARAARPERRRAGPCPSRRPPRGRTTRGAAGRPWSRPNRPRARSRGRPSRWGRPPRARRQNTCGFAPGARRDRASPARAQASSGPATRRPRGRSARDRWRGSRLDAPARRASGAPASDRMPSSASWIPFAPSAKPHGKGSSATTCRRNSSHCDLEPVVVGTRHPAPRSRRPGTGSG